MLTKHTRTTLKIIIASGGRYINYKKPIGYRNKKLHVYADGGRSGGIKFIVAPNLEGFGHLSESYTTLEGGHASPLFKNGQSSPDTLIQIPGFCRLKYRNKTIFFHDKGSLYIPGNKGGRALANISPGKAYSIEIELWSGHRYIHIVGADNTYKTSIAKILTNYTGVLPYDHNDLCGFKHREKFAIPMLNKRYMVVDYPSYLFSNYVNLQAICKHISRGDIIIATSDLDDKNISIPVTIYRLNYHHFVERFVDNRTCTYKDNTLNVARLLFRHIHNFLI